MDDGRREVFESLQVTAKQLLPQKNISSCPHHNLLGKEEEQRWLNDAGIYILVQVLYLNKHCKVPNLHFTVNIRRHGKLLASNQNWI
jgi:hypothetical protein